MVNGQYNNGNKIVYKKTELIESINSTPQSNTFKLTIKLRLIVGNQLKEIFRTSLCDKGDLSSNEWEYISKMVMEILSLKY